MNVDVPAKPPGESQIIWTLAEANFHKEATFHIKATGSWRFADWTKEACGPNGFREAMIDRTKLLCPSAPIGCLIGKFGGGFIDTDPTSIFIIGEENWITNAADTSLFLTINDDPDRFDDNSDKLVVEITELL